MIMLDPEGDTHPIPRSVRFRGERQTIVEEAVRMSRTSAPTFAVKDGTGASGDNGRNQPCRRGECPPAIRPHSGNGFGYRR